MCTFAGLNPIAVESVIAFHDKRRLDFAFIVSADTLILLDRSAYAVLLIQVIAVPVILALCAPRVIIVYLRVRTLVVGAGAVTLAIIQRILEFIVVPADAIRFTGDCRTV